MSVNTMVQGDGPAVQVPFIAQAMKGEYTQGNPLLELPAEILMHITSFVVTGEGAAKDGVSLSKVSAYCNVLATGIDLKEAAKTAEAEKKRKETEKMHKAAFESFFSANAPVGRFF